MGAGTILSNLKNALKSAGQAAAATASPLYGLVTKIQQESQSATSAEQTITPTSNNNTLQDSMSALLALNNQNAERQMEYQTQSAQQAMEFNAKEAQKTRDWQEMMSNTQYQRAMADMKKAGLNPILAYSQGGAGVPSGATASGYRMSGASSGGSETLMEMYSGKMLANSIVKIATTGIGALTMLLK